VTVTHCVLPAVAPNQHAGGCMTASVLAHAAPDPCLLALPLDCSSLDLWAPPRFFNTAQGQGTIILRTGWGQAAIQMNFGGLFSGRPGSEL